MEREEEWKWANATLWKGEKTKRGKNSREKIVENQFHSDITCSLYEQSCDYLGMKGGMK